MIPKAGRGVCLSNIGGALPNLNTAGFFSTTQTQILNVGVPLIARDPVSGRIKLTIGVAKARDLATPFTPFPMTTPQISINAQGKLEFEFDSSEDAAFFRLESH